MSSFGQLLPFLRPYRVKFMLTLLLVMATAGINLWLIRLTAPLWDALTVHRDGAMVAQTAIMLVSLFFVQAVLSVGHLYLKAWISQHVVADVRRHLFQHLHGLSLNFFAKRRTGELLSRLMNDVGTIQVMATETPVDVAKHGVILCGATAFLIYMNWKLCVVILFLLPLLVLVGRLFGTRLKALSINIQDQTAALSVIVEEVLSRIRVVKSFVQGNLEQQRFSAVLSQSIHFELRRAMVLALFIPVITFLTFSAAAGVFFYGGSQVVKGTMTPGELFAFVLFAGILIGPVGSMARLFSKVKEAQGAMERVFGILATQPDIVDVPGAIELPLVAGKIEVSNIHFAYQREQPILNGMSFIAYPGEVVAIVGPTGGGKSTLLNLLHRFYDPTEGSISIDDQDIRTVCIESLYRQIALVPQETMLFGGTIRENIRYGNVSATDEQILAASEIADAHTFIQGSPDGYDTVVGEKGLTLSGGQRQRIAIACAIVKNPRILLLDEATSSLDYESEMCVHEALFRVMAGRTIIVVAHRLTSIQHADRILVVDQGRIVEEGAHDTLIRHNGLYASLYARGVTEGQEVIQ
ncbi:MAG TPA: ABC transporter ATP-binding protein [Nitrospirales bacterium]|nr:ABC transporter ATP-binding protein [Nitrospirales bacterium]